MQEDIKKKDDDDDFKYDPDPKGYDLYLKFVSLAFSTFIAGRSTDKGSGIRFSGCKVQ